MESTDIAKQLNTISDRLERIERQQGAIAKSNKRISKQVGAVEDAVTWQALWNDAILCFVCATTCFTVASLDWIVNNSCSLLPAWGRAAMPFEICDGATTENVSWESHFDGGSDSLAAIAIGVSEGTRTADGGTTSAFNGHYDSGYLNLGTFSYIHGASSPQEADKVQIRRLKSQIEPELLELEQLGITPDTATILNLADLTNQSPRAGASFAEYLKRCQDSGKVGDDLILCARIASFEGDAPGLAAVGVTIEHDQSRRMKAIASVLSARGATTTTLALPLSPNEATVSSCFDPDRLHPVLKVVRPHLGIDLSGATGTPIRAIASGTVVTAGDAGDGFGYKVVIDHGDGLESLYAHSQQLMVKQGDRVSQGQVIALMGTTGLSTGSHLHLEIHRNGTPENPINYLDFKGFDGSSCK
ncbi:MAG: M23 family metallopeptidase [Oculatellaceae cyanobacterium bins.114]|nr:M23 family metallopeptidase [Oculatellaceae cyanobacterium bins.114]